MRISERVHVAKNGRKYAPEKGMSCFLVKKFVMDFG